MLLKSTLDLNIATAFDRRNVPVKWSPLEAALRGSADVNRTVAAAWLILLWSAVLIVDGATGPHLCLNSVYLAPLCFTVWCLGRIAGVVSGLIVISVTLQLNGFGDGLSAQASTVSTSTAALNAGVRVFGVTFIILFVGAFRRTFDQERANAQIDPLTGLGNRRAFKRESSSLELASARDNRILLCGLIDVDDFKAINDRYGHAAGDDVLSIVADALLSAVRPYDVTARLGGDEFAFCLAVRDTASAERKSGKIHDAVMAALTKTEYGATCSLGAATGVGVAETLRVADQTLYRAKDAGKSIWAFEDGPAEEEKGLEGDGPSYRAQNAMPRV
ncbi:GGDEF domain-containing protein [Sphingomonas sp. UV9]|nr:GGDEF domain-containing protein [Sphingomonas sp. UV9]